MSSNNNEEKKREVQDKKRRNVGWVDAIAFTVACIEVYLPQ